MTTQQKNRNFFIAVGLISLLVFSIAFYLGSIANKAAIDKREKEINSEPIPIEGWSVIKKSIKYPEMFYRAGVDGVADVMFRIDSLGVVKNIRIRANEAVFEDTIRFYLQNVKWLPAKRKGQNVEDSIECSIHFDSKNFGERFIIIDGRNL